MTLFERIIAARGIGDGLLGENFLHPDYESRHDSFLLPDMQKAVDRLVVAHAAQEHIMIYGDYDIDGLTATTVLVEALASFGFEHVDTFIPNRFIEGYGMTVDAVDKIATSGATLIITVDCGSLSELPIAHAKTLGIDTIVTDHHNVAAVQPPAVAVINPKRLLQDYPEHYTNFVLTKKSDEQPLYPFLDLPGVGVAFKLVQALQTKLDGLEDGQEKWLLDLVALGTVCDVVTLVDENRLYVYWGLQVLAKTRRPGLKALMAVSAVEPDKVTTRSLGFALGPRMNASGRLETARYAQDLLLSRDPKQALELASQLDEMNIRRRADQDIIYKAALEQADSYQQDPVLVLSHADWSHGIIGIVAAKILEKHHKPTYVLQELGDVSKGSARSYGDFSAADAIRASDDIITTGGGHKFAAGVTLPTTHIDAFRQRVNEYFLSLNLRPQRPLLFPSEDVAISNLDELDEALIAQISLLEPFGNGNPEPILKFTNARTVSIRHMGTEGQHLKLAIVDEAGAQIELLAFSAPREWFVERGENITVWFQPSINEWRGRRSVEGKIVRLERS